MANKVIKKIVKKKETKNKKPNKRQLLQDKIDFLESKKELLNSKDLDELESLKNQLEKSKQGRRSKNKGASYERDIIKILKKEWDVDLFRTPLSGGFAKNKNKDEFKGDINLVDKNKELLLHIECKNQKRPQIDKWFNQAEEDCPKGKIPIVVRKRQQEIKEGKVTVKSKDFVYLTLDDFLMLIKKEDIIIERKEVN